MHPRATLPRDGGDGMTYALAYRNSLAQTETDLDRFVSLVSQAIPLLDVMPQAGAPPFHARLAQVRAGDLVISTEAFTPLQASFGEDPCRASIFFPHMGESVLRMEGESLRARQGESVVYVPGCGYTCQTTTLAGVVFSVDPQRLATLAAELAGDPSRCDRYLPAFRDPHQWRFTEPLQRHLLRLMDRSIRLIDTVPGDQSRLPAYLRLDDLLFRIVTLLVHPQLLREDRLFPPPRQGGPAGES